MTTPMYADRLEVVHDDDRVTVYEQVLYWPYRGCVDILDTSGAVLVSHGDVLNTLVSTR